MTTNAHTLTWYIAFLLDGICYYVFLVSIIILKQMTDVYLETSPSAYK